MRIGFDLDGTVADLQGALAREARRLFRHRSGYIATLRVARGGADRSRAAHQPVDDPVFTMSSLSVRQQKELWAAACARVNFWEGLDEIEPGSLQRLARIVRERKWEVIFLTSRPRDRRRHRAASKSALARRTGFRCPQSSLFIGRAARSQRRCNSMCSSTTGRTASTSRSTPPRAGRPRVARR